MNANEVLTHANSRCEEICRYLLPNGHRNGNKWLCGNIYGEPGDSLKITLSGVNIGTWKDFADNNPGAKNNIISLWKEAKGLNDYFEAVDEVRDFLGLPAFEKRRESWKRISAPVERKPLKQKDVTWVCKPLVEGGRVWKWLVQVRGISPEILNLYRIGQYEEKGKQYVSFPFYNKDGVLELVKIRNIDEKKDIRTYSGYEDVSLKLLFGQQALFANTNSISELCITEGEPDALAMAEMGFNAVSVPYGAKSAKNATDPIHANNPNNEWLEHDMDWLDAIPKIYLCLDNDEKGRDATDAIYPRLGAERCQLVEFPEGYKDANACLVDGVDIYESIHSARNLDPDELCKPSDFKDGIWNEIYPPNDVPIGEEPPWKIPIRFRPSEVTVWHGWNGSGKSVCLNFCGISFGLQGKKTCIASFEMKSERTFRNIIVQLTGTARPTEAVFKKALSWMDSHFYVFNRLGNASISETLNLFRYVACKYAVSHFFIDSLMRINDVYEDQVEPVKKLMNEITAFAKRYDVHVHLVAHSKKPMDGGPNTFHKPPSKFFISGSKALSDNADNVVCVWRNEEKQFKLDQQYDEEVEKDRDTEFHVQKYRDTGYQGFRRLYFDSETMQYREYYSNQKGVCYLP